MNYDKDPNPAVRVHPKFDVPRQAAIDMKCCTRCGGEAEIFEDENATRIYRQTGLCQSCQFQDEHGHRS